MTITERNPTGATQPVTHRSLTRATALGTATAFGGSLAVWVVARLAGSDLVVTPPGSASSTTVGVPMIAISTIVGAVLGGLLALVARRCRRPRFVFVAIAILGTVLSFGGPAQAADAGSTTVALIAMHVVAAAAIIPIVAATLPAKR